MLGWLSSFRQPVLTQRERVLRWVVVASTIAMLVGLGLAVQPWLRFPGYLLLGVGVACAASVALWVARQLLLARFADSRARLRASGYLICPSCQYALIGATREHSKSTRLRADPIATPCPECGLQLDTEALGSRWREAYRIHFDAWTPDPDDGD